MGRPLKTTKILKYKKREKALVQPVTPKRKPAKNIRKQKKQSLAELPAELKHITQRCKKKVTTIAEVTASELAIFSIYICIYICILYMLSVFFFHVLSWSFFGYVASKNPKNKRYEDEWKYEIIYDFVHIYIVYIFLSRRPGKRKMCGSKTEKLPKNGKKQDWTLLVIGLWKRLYGIYIYISICIYILGSCVPPPLFSHHWDEIEKNHKMFDIEEKRREKRKKTMRMSLCLNSLSLSLSLSCPALLKCDYYYYLDNLEWFCLRGWQPLLLCVVINLLCWEIRKKTREREKNNKVMGWLLAVTSSFHSLSLSFSVSIVDSFIGFVEKREKRQTKFTFFGIWKGDICTIIIYIYMVYILFVYIFSTNSSGVKLFENAVWNVLPTQGVSFESVTNIGCGTDSAKVDCSNGEKYFAERVKSIWNWSGFTGGGWPFLSAKSEKAKNKPDPCERNCWASLRIVAKPVQRIIILIVYIQKKSDI